MRRSPSIPLKKGEEENPNSPPFTSGSGGNQLASDDLKRSPSIPLKKGEEENPNSPPSLRGGWGDQYQPFNGIVLTDTFQMFESQGTLNEVMFPENNQRVVKQRNNDIRVIIGNPPYSAGQTSENDGNKNLKYPALDDKIRDTYARYSSATNKNSLYDSYIRAIRWASDRIKDRGIVCFVTNGSFIDNNAMDGLLSIKDLS